MCQLQEILSVWELCSKNEMNECMSIDNEIVKLIQDCLCLMSIIEMEMWRPSPHLPLLHT